ncbi:MAG TPA: protein kinase [Rhodocyclaceae bacterium]|nr:protein kinase [Rhodocyclaceae bacterium]
MTKKIGRFEIRRELGRGAQSVVYLGLDPQLQREVAIKTMHFAQPSPDQNKMLLSEARMVSKLRHPNIVPIFDAGEQENDLYLVFEYVPGKTLSDFLRSSGALPAVQAVSKIRPVLDAVAAAHAQGIIHRDLKPSNILLDENGTPRVMDFGIAARVEGEAGKNAEEYTGTPAYMAPEYIDKRAIDARTDIFAAGLILFEMLTGRRAVEGKNVFQVMHRIVNADIRLPEGSGVDDRLADILYRAIARDPEKRYASIGAFSEALDAYLTPDVEQESRAPGKQATVEFLMRRLRQKSDFPALSESVSTINKIASSETESINKLSSSILKDFALTNKILKLVNSAHFRPAGGGSISTVSRAVIVLGFEAVRNIAITVLLFEHLQNKSNAAHLKEEFLRANLAGVLAKDLGAQAKMRDLEQSFICSLFQNLGRLLAQYYFPEESEEIRNIALQKSTTEDAASVQVLGVSYEDLGIEIAQQWGFPPLIVNTMHKLPAGKVRKPATTEERLQMLSGISNELCGVIAGMAPEKRDAEMKKMIARYHDALPLDEKQLRETMTRAVEEIKEYAQVIHLNLQKTAIGRQMIQFAGGKVGTDAADDPKSDGISQTVLRDGGFTSDEEEIDEATGKPVVDAQAILTAGIQDISNTLVEGFKLNDILRIILETMYRAMGFKRVILCIRDAKAGVMQGRFGFGDDATEVAKKFRFATAFSPDIFHAVTSKGVDILISDIDDPKIAPRIPDWYRKLVPAKSFVLLPLTIKNNPVALIYADQDSANGIAMPEKELSLLRTLRNQAVLAIKQGS